jgi:flavin-dependent dehydrogenase
LSVTVADPAQPQIDKACGEGMMPDALSALQHLGIRIDPGEGAIFRGIKFKQPGAQVEARFQQSYGLGIRRRRLHQILVDHATRQGVKIEWGRRVTGAPPIASRWVIGADGQNSATRTWAGLDKKRTTSRRFGFRRHFQVVPWTDRVEVHWGDNCQAYVTPVGEEEICIALISGDGRTRFDDLYNSFPELANRVRGARPTSAIKGAVSVTCRVAQVANQRVALVGDAAGSIDAITGQGLAIAFQQAVAIGEALASGNLAKYRAAHRRIVRQPATMANLMLQLDRHPKLRRGAIALLAAEPEIFANLLAFHVGRPIQPTANLA